MRFQFSRHLQSCNNANLGEKTISSIIGKNIDIDPAGTTYGIIQTIEFAQKSENKYFYNSDKVFVSNLLRTWITAFLLYGTNLENSKDTLKLYISPYLKEYSVYDRILKKGGDPFKRGNYPLQVSETIKNFVKFLMHLEPEKMKEFYSEHLPKNYKKWYYRLPTYVEIYLPNKDLIFENSNYFSINIDNYNVKQFNIIDTIGPKSSQPAFLKGGDLKKFMKWYESNESNFNYSNYIVHVVTHSKVMRNFIYKKIKDFEKNIKKEKKSKCNIKRCNENDEKCIHYCIRNSNCWRFNYDTYQKDEDGNFGKITSYVPGIPLDIKKSKLSENPKHSLCGKYKKLNKNKKQTKQNQTDKNQSDKNLKSNR